MTPRFLQGEEQRRIFLREFEAGTLPAVEWTHAAHIAMATVYLPRYGDDVLAHTRTAIRNYLVARDKAITHYHETLTIFWLALVAESMKTLHGLSENDMVLANHALFGSTSRLCNEFYSFDVPSSQEARERWIAPDLKPLAVPFRIEG